MGKGSKGIHKSASQRTSLIAGQANRKENIPEGLLSFNFKFLDTTQGQTFEEWEKLQLLSQAFAVFKNYSAQTISEAFNDKFKTYKDFPPKDKTDFTHPKHVPEDARWASMHIQGKPCVIGHVHYNVFYVVFLDKEHAFYKTELKHT